MALSLLAIGSAGAQPSVEAMRDHRRVLIVAAPSPDDPHLARQRSILDRWAHGADERDLSLVTAVGDRVTGSADSSRALRHRWRLPADAFEVVLVGKDGHEAMRSSRPVTGAALESTIDAMPMRRAGLR